MDKPETPLTLAAKDGRRISNRPPARKPAARKRKRPVKGVGQGHRWEPSAAERKLISVALAAGHTTEQVAAVAGVGIRTLQRTCKKELRDGAAGVNAKVANKLFEKCMKGDTIALIYWTKTRMGWNEKAQLEITGKNGGPIQHETVRAEADAFTARVASMADRFAKTMASQADEAEPANDGELTQKSTEAAVGE